MAIERRPPLTGKRLPPIPGRIQDEAKLREAERRARLLLAAKRESLRNVRERRPTREGEWEHLRSILAREGPTFGPGIARMGPDETDITPDIEGDITGTLRRISTPFEVAAESVAETGQLWFAGAKGLSFGLPGGGQAFPRMEEPPLSDFPALTAPVLMAKGDMSHKEAVGLILDRHYKRPIQGQIAAGFGLPVPLGVVPVKAIVVGLKGAITGKAIVSAAKIAYVPLPPPRPGVPLLYDVAGEMRPVAEQLKAAYTQDILRNVSNKIRQVPVLRKTRSVLFGHAAEVDEVDKGYILRESYYSEINNNHAPQFFSAMTQEGDMKKLFGETQLLTLRDQHGKWQTIDTGLFLGRSPETRAFKGKHLNEIIEHPDLYQAKMTPEQARYVETQAKLHTAITELYEHEIGAVEKFGLMDGENYAGRRAVARTTLNDEGEEALEVFYLEQVGKELVEGRVMRSMSEAIARGFFYLDPETYLTRKYQYVLRRIADKRTSEWFDSEVTRLAAEGRITVRTESLLGLKRDAIATRRAKLRILLAQDKESALTARRITRRMLPFVKADPDFRRRFVESATDIEVHSDEVTKLGGNLTRQVLNAEVKRLNRIIDRMAGEARTIRNAELRQQAIPITHELDTLKGDLQKLLDIGPSEKRIPAAWRRTFGDHILGLPEQGNDGLAMRIIKDIERLPTQKRWEPLSVASNIAAGLRLVALGADASVFGIQLLLLSTYKPQVFIEAIPKFFEAMIDSRAYSRMIVRNRTLLNRHPGLQLSGGGLNEVTEFLDSRAKIFSIPSGFNYRFEVGTWPLKPFQRGFEAAMDYAGIEMIRALEPLAKNATDLARIDDFVNSMRGMLSSQKLGISPIQRQVETLLFLAPRYNRAVAALLVSAFRGDITGRQALRALMQFTVGVFVATTAASLVAGNSWEETLDHLTPLKQDDTGDWHANRNFMMWDTLDQKVGVGSKFLSLVNLVAKSAADPEDLLEISWKNPVFRWVRGNLSIPVGQAIDFIDGRDFMGDPTRDGVWTAANHLAGAVVPVAWRSFAEEGRVLPKFAQAGAEFFGGRAYWRGKQGVFEDKAVSLEKKIDDTLFARHYPDVERADLTYEDIAAAPRRDTYYKSINEETRVLWDDTRDELERHERVNKYTLAIGVARDDFALRVDEAAQIALRTGDLVRFKQRYQHLGSDFAAQQRVLQREHADAWADLQKRGQSKNPARAATNEYWSILHDPQWELPGGEFDFEGRETALREWRGRWSQTHPQAVEDVLGGINDLRENMHPLVQDMLFDRDTRLKVYWGLLESIAPRGTPRGRIFREYLATQDASMRAGMKRQFRFLGLMERRLTFARRQLRYQRPEIDLALAKWRGATPLTSFARSGIIAFREQLHTLSKELE